MQTALQMQIPHKCRCSCRTCSGIIEGDHAFGDTTVNTIEDITPDADTTAESIADGDTIIDITADTDAIVGAIPEVSSNADTIIDSI